MLPHPDTFSGYPPEAQRTILEEYRLDMAHVRELEKADMELDRAQSERLDRSQELESRSIGAAQAWTGVLNVLLLTVALVLGVLGYVAASIAAFGALAVINVSAFLPRRLGGRDGRKK